MKEYQYISPFRISDEIGEFIDGSYHFKDNCDSGDHLHPSKHAYDLMGKLAANITK